MFVLATPATAISRVHVAVLEEEPRFRPPNPPKILASHPRNMMRAGGAGFTIIVRRGVVASWLVGQGAALGWGGRVVVSLSGKRPAGTPPVPAIEAFLASSLEADVWVLAHLVGTI
eukprot:COSAG04_NODE_49_length_31209_cov_11.630248_11_plen_116_part_00